MPDNKKLDYIQERIDAACESLAKIDKDVAIQRTSLEAHTKQDEQMYEELRRMNDILQSNTESLKEHMQNNVLLKEMIVKMDNRLNPIEQERLEAAAVQAFATNKLKLLLKIAAAVGFLAGAWTWLWPSLSHLLK
jgi:septal ring factor EnvC (AmiA/AmiB activator)